MKERTGRRTPGRRYRRSDGGLLPSIRRNRVLNRIFFVLRSRGPGWDDSEPLQSQKEWPAHAAFMDSLFEEGFAALVGPLEGTRDALLILRASGVSEIVERLAADPWTINGLLTTKQISPWQLRLGSLEIEQE
jgi:uncharacterized protein YciI